MEEFTPKLVGARVKRREDERLIAGRGAYVDDYAPSGLLHAAFLRSAYARITEIDTAAAHTMAGVAAVLTGPRIAELVKPVRAASKMREYRETAFPPLAIEKVRYSRAPTCPAEFRPYPFLRSPFKFVVQRGPVSIPGSVSTWNMFRIVAHQVGYLAKKMTPIRIGAGFVDSSSIDL